MQRSTRSATTRRRLGGLAVVSLTVVSLTAAAAAYALARPRLRRPTAAALARRRRATTPSPDR
jgi:hypothetical protein